MVTGNANSSGRASPRPGSPSAGSQPATRTCASGRAQPHSREYAAGHCDLGYALTWHAVEGRTVSVGIALASDNRTRSGLYPAMTRGEQRNDVYAYPAGQEPAGSVIGRGPAADPELARQRRLEAGRDQSGPGATAGERDPVAILARVIRRDAHGLCIVG